MGEQKYDTYQKIFFKILNFLSYKPRTQKELETKLELYLSKEKKSQEEKDLLFKKALLQLEQDGYLNDKKTAQLYVDSFINSPKAKSINSLKIAMRRKGFTSQEIEDSTSSLSDDLEVTGALKVGKKKLLALKGSQGYIKKAKLNNFLYLKGYSTRTIKAVVDTLLSLQ